MNELKSMDRRQMLQSLLQSLLQGAAVGGVGSATLSLLSGCASAGGSPTKAQVVVVGGGYAGATAAKYIRLLSDYRIDVMLIEPNRRRSIWPASVGR